LAEGLTKQIPYFFIVDFDERATDEHLNSVVLCFEVGHIDEMEHMIEHLRHNALVIGRVSTYHRICFAAASLPVGENCSVIALK